MHTSDVYKQHRRVMDLDDYLDAARRHKAWIAGPMFAGLVLSVAAACAAPAVTSALCV